MAQANQAETLTDALAVWTAQLWRPSAQEHLGQSAAFYIDGHRKPVYTDVLIPRGLVGRLSTVLGCRALVLLHDEHGHPLLATTHRGDAHLTIGLPSIVARYEQQAGMSTVKRIIVDREGMAAEFLATLRAAGRTVISVLRTDQYGGLESFTDIGSFVPLRVSTSGKVVREVAPASIALPLPDHPGESLLLRVALIRDLCRHVPIVPSKEDVEYPKRWDADLDWHDRMWWDEGWKATPTPAISTTRQHHSHRDDSFYSGCSRTCPNLHAPLDSARKHHSRFLAALGAGYQSWVQQKACGEFGGRQETGCFGKTARQCAALGGCCSQAFAQRE
jgi:hypothetical protein